MILLTTTKGIGVGDHLVIKRPEENEKERATVEEVTSPWTLNIKTSAGAGYPIGVSCIRQHIRAS